MDDDPITGWFLRLAADGDPEAAQRLWEHYYERLLQLARRRLSPGHRRVTDEEDVVVSAFDSFCRRVAAGRFPRLDNREDLWKLLVTMTARKAVDHQKREGAIKRGGGAVRGESAFGAGQSDEPGGIEQVMGREPTPAFAAMLAEQYESCLAQLKDESLCHIAQLWLENRSLAEIAAAMDCSMSTVKRELRRIRKKWSTEAGHDPEGKGEGT